MTPIQIIFVGLAAVLTGLMLAFEPWQINIAIDCYTVAVGLSFAFIARKSAMEAIMSRAPRSENLFVIGAAAVLTATALIRGFRLIVWSTGQPVPIDTYIFAMVSVVQLFGFAMLLMGGYNTDIELRERAYRSLGTSVVAGTVLAVVVFTLHWWRFG